MSFGTVSAVGFVGSSMTFSVIFTAPRELASPEQITFMCWAFSCYTTAFAAGASAQIFLTMVSPTVGEQPARSKHSWLLNVALYFSITLVSTGTFLLGIAILGKVKGAGVFAIVFPSTIVILTVGAAAYVNHVGDDAEVLESRGDIEEGNLR